jgi:hypothetical protein
MDAVTLELPASDFSALHALAAAGGLPGLRRAREEAAQRGAAAAAAPINSRVLDDVTEFGVARCGPRPRGRLRWAVGGWWLGGWRLGVGPQLDPRLPTNPPRH